MYSYPGILLNQHPRNFLHLPLMTGFLIWFLHPFSLWFTPGGLTEHIFWELLERVQGRRNIQYPIHLKWLILSSYLTVSLYRIKLKLFYFRILKALPQCLLTSHTVVILNSLYGLLFFFSHWKLCRIFSELSVLNFTVTSTGVNLFSFIVLALNWKFMSFRSVKLYWILSSMISSLCSLQLFECWIHSTSPLIFEKLSHFSSLHHFLT